MTTRLKRWILSWTFVDNAIREQVSNHFFEHLDELAKDAPLTLAREILNIKDFSQVKRDLSPDERKRYCAAASVIYTAAPFLDIIREIQYDQLLFTVLQSDNDRQLMIARGTINGADLIESRIAALHAEHLQNMKDTQPVDGSQQFEPVSKLDVQ